MAAGVFDAGAGVADWLEGAGLSLWAPAGTAKPAATAKTKIDERYRKATRTMRGTPAKANFCRFILGPKLGESKAKSHQKNRLKTRDNPFDWKRREH